MKQRTFIPPIALHTLNRFRFERRKGSVIILSMAVLVMLVILVTAYIQTARIDRQATLNNNPPTHADDVAESVIQKIRDVLRDDLIEKAPSDKWGEYFKPGIDEPYDYPHTNPNAPGTYDDAWLATTHFNPEIDASGKVTRVHWGHMSDLYNTLARNNVAVDPTPRAPYADADGDKITDSMWVFPPASRKGGLYYTAAIRIIDNSSLINLDTSFSNINDSFNYTVDASQPSPNWWNPTSIDLGTLIKQVAGGQAGASDMLHTLKDGLFTYRAVGDVQYSGPITDPKPTTSTLYPQERVNNGDRETYWTRVLERGPSPSRPGLGIDSELELRYRNGRFNDHDVRATIEQRKMGLTKVFDPRVNAAEGWWLDRNTVKPSTTVVPAAHPTVPRQHLTVASKTSLLDPSPYSHRNGQLKFDINHKLFNDPADPPASSMDDFRKLIEERVFAASTLRPGSLGASNVASMYTACMMDFFYDHQEVERGIGMYQSGNAVAAPSHYFGMRALPFLTEVYIEGGYRVVVPAPAGQNTIWQKNSIGFVIEIINPFGSAVMDLTKVQLYDGQSKHTLATLTGKSRLDPYHGLVLYTDAHARLMYNSNAPIDAVWSEHLVDVTMFSGVGFGTDIKFELQVEAVEIPVGATRNSKWVTYSRIRGPAKRKKITNETLNGNLDPDWVKLRLPSLADLRSQFSPSFTPAENGVVSYLQRSVHANRLALNIIGAVCDNSNTNVEDFYGLDGGRWHPLTESGPPPALGYICRVAGGPIAKSDIAIPNPTATDIENFRKAALKVDTAVDKLDNHGVASDSYWSSPWVPDKQRRELRTYAFANGRPRYVTDLLQVMWVGPTESETYAEVFRARKLSHHVPSVPSVLAGHDNNVTGSAPPPNIPSDWGNDPLRQRMLDVTSANANEPSSPGVLTDTGIPRVADFLGSLSTFSARPADPSSIAATVIRPQIPGLINVNTATMFENSASTMYFALPLPGEHISGMQSASTLPQAGFKLRLINGLMSLRDKTTSTWSRSNPSVFTRRKSSGVSNGVVSIGEFLQVPEAVEWGFDQRFNETVEELNDPSNITQVAFDNASGNHRKEAIGDNREEEVRLTGFLGQVLTTRSDVFTAYIRIRGFDPSSGSIDSPQDDKRYVVVFDRSNLVPEYDYVPRDPSISTNPSHQPVTYKIFDANRNGELDNGSLNEVKVIGYRSYSGGN